MGQRPATISQADLSRLLRAARKEGARAVKVSLRTGETAEFVLGEGENSGDNDKAKVAKKQRSIF